MDKNKGLLVGIICLLITVFVLFYFIIKRDNKSIDSETSYVDNTEQVKRHYNKFVKTNKEASLYNEDKNEIGKIGKNVELTLTDMDIDKDTEYFKIEELGNIYYIKYDDVEKIDSLSILNDRYKKYIVFNQNIQTKDVTSFYDEKDNLIYQINESVNLPIIIKETDKYGVEYNNRLLYVKNSDVENVISNYNTDLNNATGVGVLNYHFFYDENNPEEAAGCFEEICHSKTQFKAHLDFLKENNILTLKTKEVEDYIDGKIQLPKSVLITIDDGARTKLGIDMLTEYGMYGTLFLVTSVYNPEGYYTTDNIEIHSHSHNLHKQGDCPSGQDGGIQCLDKQVILEDLKTSRDLLNNTTVFCYPFYEYNDYSISILKEAGFTMAFAGEKGDALVKVGMDKFRLPRFVVVDYTTMNNLRNYFAKITN